VIVIEDGTYNLSKVKKKKGCMVPYIHRGHRHINLGWGGGSINCSREGGGGCFGGGSGIKLKEGTGEKGEVSEVTLG